MRSTLLIIASKQLRPLLLVLSVIVLYRGHNEPGGGFIGGLLAGSAFVLFAMANGYGSIKDHPLVRPFLGMSIGLGLALLAAVWPILFGDDLFFTGQWTAFGSLKLGTPLLFDFGVYLVVASMLMLVMLTVMEE